MASYFARYLLGVYVQEVLPLATRRYKPLRCEIRCSQDVDVFIAINNEFAGQTAVFYT